MIIDSHVHISGLNHFKHGSYFRATKFQKWFYRQRLKKMGNMTSFDDEFVKIQFINHLEKSRLDRAIVLALDEVYDQEGNKRPDCTKLFVSNDSIFELTGKSKKVLFGASVHPYRTDVINELERVMGLGAALIKIIPSAQNIDLESERARPFLEFLAAKKVPLLCHTGIEHVLGLADNNLNRPNKLVPALKMGVSVIAAHLAERAFIYERSFFNEWKNLALEYPALYGDISAFVMPLRIKALRDVISCKDLTKKVFYGSDFPMVPLPSSFIPQIGLKKYRDLKKTGNLFDEGLKAMEDFGVPPQFYSQIEQILPSTSANLYK